MVVRFAVQDGNYSDVSTWDGGLTIPSSNDEVFADDRIVNIDQNVTALFLSTGDNGGVLIGGGGFRWSSGTYTIDANVIAVFTNCIEITATAGLILNGNITGSDTSANNAGVRTLGDSTAIVNGNVTGGGTAGGVLAIGNNPVLINGNLATGPTGVVPIAGRVKIVNPETTTFTALDTNDVPHVFQEFPPVAPEQLNGKRRIQLTNADGTALTGLDNVSPGLILSITSDTSDTPTLYEADSGNIETATVGDYVAPTMGKIRFQEIDPIADPGAYEIQFALSWYSVPDSISFTLSAYGAADLFPYLETISFGSIIAQATDTTTVLDGQQSILDAIADIATTGGPGPWTGGGGGGSTPEEIADAVWDEAGADHATDGTMGGLQNDISKVLLNQARSTSNNSEKNRPNHLEITRGASYDGISRPVWTWDAGQDIDGKKVFFTSRLNGDDATATPINSIETVGAGQTASVPMTTADTNAYTASETPCDVRFDVIVEMDTGTSYLPVVSRGTITVTESTTYPPVP